MTDQLERDRQARDLVTSARVQRDLLRSIRTILILLVIAAVIFMAPVVLFPVSPDDIEAKCYQHQGVQQIVTSEYEGVDGMVTVVCKDGTVEKVR